LTNVLLVCEEEVVRTLTGQSPLVITLVLALL
jgi:hypothetical protein